MPAAGRKPRRFEGSSEHHRPVFHTEDTMSNEESRQPQWACIEGEQLTNVKRQRVFGTWMRHCNGCGKETKHRSYATCDQGVLARCSACGHQILIQGQDAQ
jgi:hypothetical protein